MVFIIRPWCIALSTLVGLAACDQPSGQVAIAAATVEFSDRPTVVLTLNMRFPEPARAALDHGIALPFVAEFRMRAKGVALREKRKLVLRYVPLTEQYVLFDADTRMTRQFSSFAQVQAAFDRLAFSLPESWGELNRPGAVLAIEFYLDARQLPSPLSLFAFFSPAWQLKSPEHRWQRPS